MKKVILALAIVSVTFAACNNGEKTVDTTTTSDTSVVVAAPDTTMVVTDSTVKRYSNIVVLECEVSFYKPSSPVMSHLEVPHRSGTSWDTFLSFPLAIVSVIVWVGWPFSS